MLHPNLAKIELVAHALGDLREQLVFVGGCAVDLLLTDPAAAPARVTYDVDLVAQVPGMVFPDESLAARVKLLALRFEQIGELDQA
ncbi:MAG: hypothetical protein B7Y41_08500 [Hydrogenophilales bacterium 28-61-23]|nr:MAG: hypothetical protein B7Y41_08500 [Hydrogenophilales bacterium 28-61-23]